MNEYDNLENRTEEPVTEPAQNETVNLNESANVNETVFGGTDAEAAPAASQEAPAPEYQAPQEEAPAWEQPAPQAPVWGAQAPQEAPAPQAAPEPAYSRTVPPVPDYASARGSVYDPLGRLDPDAGRAPAAPGVHTYNTYAAPDVTAPKAKKEKKKKEKKTGASKGLVAALIALCVVCSAAFGIGGVIVGSKLVDSPSQKQSAFAAKSGDKSTNNDNYSIEPRNVTVTEGSVSAAVATAAPSVVEITTEQVATSAFYGQYITSGGGSGVIISDDGYILTCAHVVSGANTITVNTQDGEEYTATVVGSDSETDVAVIKIDADGLTAAEMGDYDSIVVGESVIAIGNPMGKLGGTVTSGIVSALNREITIDGKTYSLMQFDAAINPGNSGGGLFDLDGKLIGIVNAKRSGITSDTVVIEGLSFAIPVSTVKEISEQLISNGYVKGRPALGIYATEVNSSTTQTELYQKGAYDLLDYITDYGVYFTGYAPGHDGDLQYGDRIIAIDSVTVSTRNEILNLLKDYKVGDTVTLTVSRLEADMRRSKVVEVEVTLGESNS